MQLNKLQNALSWRISGFSGGGGAKRNRRRVDGLLTDFDLGLHRLAAAADGSDSWDYCHVFLPVLLNELILPT